MPGRIPTSGEKTEAEKQKSKRGRREDARQAELAKVQLTAEAPLKPKKLDKVASEHWDYLVSLLLPLRLLTPLDGTSLGYMCRAYSIIEKSMAQVDKCMVKTVSGGTERVTSHLKIAKDWQVIYDKYADKFGMTPQARAKMRIPLPKPVDNAAKKGSRSRFFIGS